MSTASPLTKAEPSVWHVMKAVAAELGISILDVEIPVRYMRRRDEPGYRGASAYVPRAAVPSVIQHNRDLLSGEHREHVEPTGGAFYS